MTRFSPFLASVLMLLVRSIGSAAEPVIEIWPEGVPGLHPNAPAEKETAGRVTGVQHPTLTVYAPPAGKSCGTAIIICPGGNYLRLSMQNEGASPARWLNGLGVTAFVLRYRLSDYGQPAPLRDVLRAVRTVRAHAAEFGVRADRIGMLGFSAGGHLAACAGTLYDDPLGRTGAPLDQTSARPDFLMLLYPVITMQDSAVHTTSRKSLLGPSPSPELIRQYSAELNVTPRTPPAFLVATEEDKTVPVENSLLFFQALRQAGVPAEIHLYAKGPHGFGLGAGRGAVSTWPQRGEEWLRLNGWLSQG